MPEDTSQKNTQPENSGQGSLPLNQLSEFQNALNSGKLGDAAIVLRQMIQAEPLNAQLYQLSIKLSALTKDQGVLKDLYETSRKHSVLGLIAPELADAFLSCGNTDSAHEVLREVFLDDPCSADKAARLAFFYELSGDASKAQKLFLSATLLDRACTAAWHGLGRTALRNGDKQNLRKAVLALMELDVCSETSVQLAKAATQIMAEDSELHICYARACLFSGKESLVAVAYQALETASRLNPRPSADTHFLRGTCFYCLGLIERALEEHSQGLRVKARIASELGFDRLGIRFLGEDFVRAIGHMTMIEMYIKMQRMGWLKPCRAIVLPTVPVANPHYLSYLGEHIEIASEEQCRAYEPLRPYLDEHFDCFQLIDGRCINNNALIGIIQKHWDAEKRPAILSLRTEDRTRGWEVLRALGVPTNSWFVALHVRESRLGPDGQWEHPGPNRNAHIDTYYEMIRHITERGGWVVRMGNPSMRKLPEMEHVIDYAYSSARSDWMDVFLWAEAKFMIATASGPSFVPNSFGKGVVTTNWSSLRTIPPPGYDLFIPKLIWSNTESRFLKFSEVIADEGLRYTYPNKLAERNLKLIDNTASEISEVVAEMLGRIDGSLQYSKEDEELQRRFSEAIKADDATGNSRIGRAFISKYAYLL